MKTYGEWCVAPLFTSALGGGEWSPSRFDYCTPEKCLPVPILNLIILVGTWYVQTILSETADLWNLLHNYGTYPLHAPRV
jgi:hypothetical protein